MVDATALEDAKLRRGGYLEGDVAHVEERDRRGRLGAGLDLEREPGRVRLKPWPRLHVHADGDWSAAELDRAGVAPGRRRLRQAERQLAPVQRLPSQELDAQPSDLDALEERLWFAELAGPDWQADERREP